MCMALSMVLACGTHGWGWLTVTWKLLGPRLGVPAKEGKIPLVNGFLLT